LVFIIETGKGGVALNSSLQEIMNKLKEEFASNENIFITEEFNNKYLIYISYVDMQYERNIADDEYFKTNVYTLKFNALTKELFLPNFMTPLRTYPVIAPLDTILMKKRGIFTIIG
jgi:hypothetical protein